MIALLEVYQVNDSITMFLSDNQVVNPLSILIGMALLLGILILYEKAESCCITMTTSANLCNSLIAIYSMPFFCNDFSHDSYKDKNIHRLAENIV